MLRGGEDAQVVWEALESHALKDERDRDSKDEQQEHEIKCRLNGVVYGNNECAVEGMKDKLCT